MRAVSGKACLLIPSSVKCIFLRLILVYIGFLVYIIADIFCTNPFMGGWCIPQESGTLVRWSERLFFVPVNIRVAGQLAPQPLYQ